ncbi:MAG: hypothetical protein AAFO29_26960, partial [Actinomycetota bacterium]
MNIVLVTCKTWPALSRGDTELADELTARGHRVLARPWNDAPLADFTTADLAVLRSNWDYHHDLHAFASWLDQVDHSGAELRNPAALVRPHLDKSYLVDLLADGFRTPQTLVTADFDLDTVLGWVDDHGLDRVVVKPAWGASGHGVELAKTTELPALAGSWQADATRRPMLIQEFIPHIHAGEVALVYFAGTFSHAMLRQPAAGDFRVNGDHGGSASALDHVDPALIDLGSKNEGRFVEFDLHDDVIDTIADHVDAGIRWSFREGGLDL